MATGWGPIGLSHTLYILSSGTRMDISLADITDLVSESWTHTPSWFSPKVPSQTWLALNSSAESRCVYQSHHGCHSWLVWQKPNMPRSIFLFEGSQKTSHPRRFRCESVWVRQLFRTREMNITSKRRRVDRVHSLLIVWRSDKWFRMRVVD